MVGPGCFYPAIVDVPDGVLIAGLAAPQSDVIDDDGLVVSETGDGGCFIAEVRETGEPRWTQVLGEACFGVTVGRQGSTLVSTRTGVVRRTTDGSVERIADGAVAGAALDIGDTDTFISLNRPEGRRVHRVTWASNSPTTFEWAWDGDSTAGEPDQLLYAPPRNEVDVLMLSIGRLPAGETIPLVSGSSTALGFEANTVVGRVTRAGFAWAIVGVGGPTTVATMTDIALDVDTVLVVGVATGLIDLASGETVWSVEEERGLVAQLDAETGAVLRVVEFDGTPFGTSLRGAARTVAVRRREGDFIVAPLEGDVPVFVRSSGPFDATRFKNSTFAFTHAGSDGSELADLLPSDVVVSTNACIFAKLGF